MYHACMEFKNCILTALTFDNCAHLQKVLFRNNETSNLPSHHSMSKSPNFMLMIFMYNSGGILTFSR